RRRIGVVGHRVGDLAVERPPCLVEALKLLLVTCERAAGPARTAPGEIDVDLAEDDEVVGDPPACLLARHGPAPQRDHGGVGGGQRHPHGVLLDPPELVLAALGEELGDRLAGAFFDRGVEVEERAVEAIAELPAERRLARAHETDEDDVAAERVQRHPTRSTYARHAATKSPTASPPNFSCAARASSQATADSATTASASTAATSDRSTSACAASPVWRSTDASGFISVGSGFIAARTMISSPFDTPASIPPARFVSRCRSVRISSCASEPNFAASANPSPISTPFTAWIPITAAASRASSRSSFAAYEPSPGGTPRARTSTT